MGPFQTTVPAPLIAAENSSMVLGPMSRPIQPSGISLESTTWLSVSGSNSLPTLVSTGSRNFTPAFSAFSRVALARSSLSSSHREVPME